MHADAGIAKPDCFFFFVEYIMNAESMLHVLFIHLYMTFTLVVSSSNSHLQLHSSHIPFYPVHSVAFFSSAFKGILVGGCFLVGHVS